ncbi:hypothetical protein BJ322DRAFT_355502 [Thelephora terrestris]|uniref:Uncharacterized protein n=1 Tax=Thelephora terrestris TaxID=56493 RepID=A0A9P6H552_9AGAM|nr:hypothetical protein BJ322DRAFT_355502 [Thelephora terrestris]
MIRDTVGKTTQSLLSLLQPRFVDHHHSSLLLPSTHESTTTTCKFPAWRFPLRGSKGRNGVPLCRCTLAPTSFLSTVVQSLLKTDCGAKNEIRPREPIRCRECGHRIMYKKRTKRMVQFEARNGNPFLFTYTLWHVPRGVCLVPEVILLRYQCRFGNPI